MWIEMMIQVSEKRLACNSYRNILTRWKSIKPRFYQGNTPFPYQIIDQFINIFYL